MNADSPVQRQKTPKKPLARGKTEKAKPLSEATGGEQGNRQTPINISTQEGEALRRCSESLGQPVGNFVRDAILERIKKLEPSAITSLPCPFCKKTDALEIIHWNSERRDGTEYSGDAVKCHRCEAVATVAAWAGVELHGISPFTADNIGGVL